jgi:hypothetical protein
MSKIIPLAFGQWAEEQLSKLPPQEVRLHEAFFMYEMFRLSCGQKPLWLKTFTPNETQFAWITYADAFLMMVASVEELVPWARRDRLRNSELFRFVLQLRNITVHKTVLGGRKQKHGATPLVNRIYNVSVGEVVRVGEHHDYVDPKINFPRIENQLSKIKKSGQHTQHIAGSRLFLRNWTQAGKDCVILRELFEEALAFVGKTCGIKMQEA